MTMIPAIGLAPACPNHNPTKEPTSTEKKPGNHGPKPGKNNSSVFIPTRQISPAVDPNGETLKEPASKENGVTPTSKDEGLFPDPVTGLPETISRGLPPTVLENPLTGLPESINKMRKILERVDLNDAHLSENPIKTTGILIGWEPKRWYVRSPLRLGNDDLGHLTPEQRIEILTQRIDALKEVQRRSEAFDAMASIFHSLQQVVADAHEGIFHGDYPALTETYQLMMSIPETSPEYQEVSAQFEMLVDAYICEQTGMDMAELCNLGLKTAQEGFEVYKLQNHWSK
jgi:hypothetical protein